MKRLALLFSAIVIISGSAAADARGWHGGHGGWHGGDGGGWRAVAGRGSLPDVVTGRAGEKQRRAAVCHRLGEPRRRRGPLSGGHLV